MAEPNDPPRDEAALAAELATMVASSAEAASLLTQLASGLFPSGAGDLARLTWPEVAPGGDGHAGGARAPGAPTAEPEIADAMLRAAEMRYRTLVEQIPAVTFILVLGEGKNEVYVSPHIEALLGFTQTEWLEDPFLWFYRLHPADREIWIDEFARGCRTGGPFHAECRFLARDGHVVWVRGEARLIKDALGRPMFIQGIAFDITESRAAHESLLAEMAERRRTEEALRESEEQLRQSQKIDAIGRLAGGIAHDFNNMLTVIIGRTAMLAHRFPVADPVGRQVDLIHKTAQRAAGLTRQLLAFSRKQVLKPKVLDLNALATDLEPMLRRLIGEHITIRTQFEPALGKVMADPGQIEQVILNLALNARDAMPDGGTLTLATTKTHLGEVFVRRHPGAVEGMYVALTVADTGDGMDDAVQARIFEPFFTTKGVGKGTGLGLATVYGIVKQHDGYITVDSKLGEGTMFGVYLPWLEVPPPPDDESNMRTDLPGGTEIVLLVEDEEDVRDLAREMLEELGYTVLVAGLPEDALRIGEREGARIRLMVTDVVMPQMSGRQLVDRLHMSNPSMKVMYMSGYTDDAIVHHGVLEANTILLQKPFTLELLARTVRQALGDLPPER